MCKQEGRCTPVVPVLSPDGEAPPPTSIPADSSSACTQCSLQTSGNQHLQPTWFTWINEVFYLTYLLTCIYHLSIYDRYTVDLRWNVDPNPELLKPAKTYNFYFTKERCYIIVLSSRASYGNRNVCGHTCVCVCVCACGYWATGMRLVWLRNWNFKFYLFLFSSNVNIQRWLIANILDDMVFKRWAFNSDVYYQKETTHKVPDWSQLIIWDHFTHRYPFWHRLNRWLC